MDAKTAKFKLIQDSRGKLIVFLRQSELDEGKKKFGQIYFITFSKKGVVRGNHYHKKWREWFGIVKGKLQVVVEDVRTKERKEFILNANTKDKYVRLEAGPYIAHSFKSLTKYAALLNYADDEWHKGDVFSYKLL